MLRSVTGSLSLAYACAPVPLTGGFWAELFAFSLAQPPDGWPHDLVARMMPEASTARKETLIQAAVAAAGFPTPVIRAAGGPDDGLGRAFMVMDRAPGAPLLSGLSLTGALGRGPALFGEIPRLIDHPARPAPDVICHGDLHPFNLLRDGARVTLLDWSTALLAPREYDVASTSLALSEAALTAPGWLRSPLRWTGRRIASRFVRSYQASTGVVIDRAGLAWHQAAVCLRALVEVSGWVHSGQQNARGGHPWMTSGPALAARLAATTGVAVRPR